jgi:hypothetical protein
MDIIVSGMGRLLSHYLSDAMNAAAPDGAPPWRFGTKKFKKKHPAHRASHEFLKLRSIE